MGTVNYSVTAGTLPITVELVGSGLLNNVHYVYESGVFNNVNQGTYTLRFTDADLDVLEYEVKPYDFTNLFEHSICIPNEENNNQIEGTAITVVDIDTGANTIEVSYLPPYSSIYNPTSGKEWIVGIGLGPEPSIASRDFAYLRITGGNPVTKVLNYDIVRSEGSFTIGAQIYFYNIFNNGWIQFSGSSATIPNGTKAENSTAITLRAIWQHSDTTYRAVCTGYNGSTNTHMIYSSADLETWSWVKSVSSGSSLGDWRNDWSVVNGKPYWDSVKSKWFTTAYGYDGVSKLMTGWIYFDEDFNNLEYAPAAIINDADATLGHYEPTICYDECTWKISAAARIGSTGTDWEMREYYANDKEGPYCYVRQMLSHDIQSITTNHYSYYATITCYFQSNGELYSLVGGSSQWNASGNRSFRQFGTMKFNRQTETWEPDTKGIMIGGHQFSDVIWNTLPGHIGAVPTFYETDDYMYFFTSMTVTTDDYKVVGFKKYIPPTLPTTTTSSTSTTSTTSTSTSSTSTTSTSTTSTSTSSTTTTSTTTTFVMTDILFVTAEDIIVKSTDGGASWSTVYQSFGGQQVSDVLFLDSNTGYAVGSTGIGSKVGAVLKTTDGGDTWVDQAASLPAIATDAYYYSMSASSNYIYVVGANYNVIKLNTGTGVWSDVSNTTANVWMSDVHAINDSIVVSVGNHMGGDSIFRTTNGGSSWSSPATDPTEYFSVVLFKDINGTAITVSGTDGQRVYKTSDAGATWVLDPTTAFYTDSVYGISSPTANDIFVCGKSGSIMDGRFWKSTNNGTSWQSLSSNLPVDVSMCNCTTFKDANYGWVGTGDGRVLYTPDAGNSWTSFTTPISGQTSSIYLKA